MNDVIPAGFAIFLMVICFVAGIALAFPIQMKNTRSILIENKMAEYACDPSTGETTFYLLSGTNRIAY